MDFHLNFRFSVQVRHGKNSRKRRSHTMICRDEAFHLYIYVSPTCLRLTTCQMLRSCFGNNFIIQAKDCLSLNGGGLCEFSNPASYRPEIPLKSGSKLAMIRVSKLLSGFSHPDTGVAERQYY